MDILNKKLLMMIVAAAACCCALVASAAERTWDGGGDDDLMSSAAKWSGDTAPVASDTAIVHANATKPAIVPSGETQYSLLVIGGHGTLNPLPTFEEGFIVQTNGTLKITGSDPLRIGRYTDGTYTITNGTLISNKGFVGIAGGTGKLVIKGDGKVVPTALSVAVVGPNNHSQKTTGYVEIDENGSLSISGIFEIGAAGGTKGYAAKVEQKGGMVYSGELHIAQDATTEAEYIQTGGTNAASIASIGYNASGRGTYELSGGLFSVTNTLNIGHNGTGILDISGSGVVTIRGNVNLGFESNGKGTLILRDGGTLIANHVKKHLGTAVLAEFDGGTLQARQADTILKDLANIQLKSHGLTLATETYNQTVMNCTFNVTDGGSITVTGSGKVTFSGCTFKFNNRPSGATYVFAEVADGSDATLEGLPTLAGDVCSDWRLKLSEDKKKILAVPPGLIIIVM